MARTMTPADKAMIAALAQVVAADRINRMLIDREWVDPTGKGRTRTLRDPDQLDPTPAEAKWMELQAQFASGLITWRDLTKPTQEGSLDDPEVTE